MKGWILAMTLASAGAASAAPPITLHPNNPHYFLFRGKPTVLITSTEHYGAVLNSDFNYAAYLDALHAAGLNLTRTFSGVYCEVPGSFNIKNNTLAPLPGKLICPWARGDAPGYVGGGNKFDLTKWDDSYFRRLKEFLSHAGSRGIVVELVLFCVFYEDILWKHSPMNAESNVNGIGAGLARNEVLTLKNRELLAVQESFVRKIVTELRDVDNVYYEICNEPYFGAADDWQDHIAAVIAEAEAEFSRKHLIARNVANGSVKVPTPNPNVSILNFHYSAPPDSVAMNYGLSRAIGDDETGFRGSGDALYRCEGWDFILAGGAVYDNLDYSFSVGHEDGSGTPDAPGGGGATLRKQLGILKTFIDGFDFIKMKPGEGFIAGRGPGVSIRALSEPGKAYAIYVRRIDGQPRAPQTAGPPTWADWNASLVLDLPAGRWRAEWLNTATGAAENPVEFDHAGGHRKLDSPKFAEDIALRIVRLVH